jgi:Zn-dependent alcohol dehydrogenase
VSIVPSYSCGPNDTREALKLFQAGSLKPEDFISESYSVEAAPEAFRAMASGEVLKAVVKFENYG